MFNYIWPLALVVLSNTVYQICSKSVPDKINPFASLTITYLVGALVSFLLYFAFSKHGNILLEYKKLNWAPFLLGLSIVGLEVGFIFAYKAGWQVSVAATVQSAFLAVALMLVGWLLFHEALTLNKVIGVAVCLVGLAIINYR